MRTSKVPEIWQTLRVMCAVASEASSLQNSDSYLRNKPPNTRGLCKKQRRAPGNDRDPSNKCFLSFVSNSNVEKHNSKSQYSARGRFSTILRISDKLLYLRNLWQEVRRSSYFPFGGRAITRLINKLRMVGKLSLLHSIPGKQIGRPGALKPWWTSQQLLEKDSRVLTISLPVIVVQHWSIIFLMTMNMLIILHR